MCSIIYSKVAFDLGSRNIKQIDLGTRYPWLPYPFLAKMLFRFATSEVVGGDPFLAADESYSFGH